MRARDKGLARGRGLRIAGGEAGVPVAVNVGVDDGVPVNVAVAVGVAPVVQLGNLKAPTLSRQSAVLVVGRYSLIYQNVQSSVGSIFIDV